MLRNLESKTETHSLAKEVFSQHPSVPLDFCSYLIELKKLQLSENITGNYSNLTEKIVETCVENLKEDSLSIKILKLQLFWGKKYQPRDEIKKIHHERVFKNAVPLLTEIAEDNALKNIDKDLIYKKIVIFVIMFAGLGSPTQQSILKEAQAALHSIFKPTEIENFLTLPKTTKEQQLVEIARLITGIMLFNKDCKKGGEGMDDLPLILSEGVDATKDRFLSFKDQLDQKIEKLVKPLVFFYTRNDEGKVEIVAEHENAVSLSTDFQKVEELKTLLIYFRQVEFCLNDLTKDLEKSFLAVDELVERLQSTLLQVHNVVRYRVAVATVQVFPLFLQLSNVWVLMQEEVDVLSEINNNFVDLSLTAKSILSTSWEPEWGPDETAVPDENEIRQTSDFFPGIKVCSISSLSNQECLQYKGFCAWTLAHTEGVLITGNITLGVLQFSDRFYIFSSAEAAYKWASNPNHFIKTILKVARSKPELIKFLNLENDLLEKLTTAEEDRKPSVANAEIQTELHPVESYADKGYTSSEWEMKRRALKLAALTRCVTKSQQTVSGQESCFRTEMGVQVTPSANAATQTTRDRSCNHPAAPRSVFALLTRLPEPESKRFP